MKQTVLFPPDFEITLPTAEELHASCLAKYELVGATYIDQWPQEWHELSMPTKLVPISSGCIDEMWSMHDGNREVPALEELARELDAAMAWDEKFIRLNSRSPKDYEERPITRAGRQAISWIVGSERTMDDLTLMHHARKPAYVALRDQIWIHKPSELRCFVKDGSLICVSQYFYDKPQAQWQSEAKRMEAWDIVHDFWWKSVHPPSPLQSYVFDVMLRPNERPLLIEINPYGLSDPCAARSYEALEGGGVFFFIPDAIK